MKPITRDRVRALAATSFDVPMTSCYLDVDGRRFARHPELMQAVEQVLRRARDRADGHGSVQRDMDRIAEYVRGGVDRSETRGLAIFSCADAAFWEVVALPTSVPAQVHVGSGPALAPLEAALADQERIAVLLVDRARIRLHVLDWGVIVDHAETVDDLLRDYDDRPRGDVSGHVEERDAAHVRNAARVAFSFAEKSGYEHLVLGGEKSVVAEVERAFHPYVEKRYRGRVDLAANATVDEIRRVAIATDARLARAREAEAVATLREQAHPGGRAVTGLAATLAALGEQRVERLLVSADYQESGWRCDGCGRLAALGPACPACGARMVAVDDVVSEAVDRALGNGCRVDACVGNADLDVAGRIGALLRF